MSNWLKKVKDGAHAERIRSLKASIGPQAGREIDRERLGVYSSAYAQRVTVYTSAIGGSVVVQLDPETHKLLGSKVLSCDWHPANSYLNSEERALRTLGYWINELRAGR